MHSLKYNLLKKNFLRVVCTPWKCEKDPELQGHFYTMLYGTMDEVPAWGPYHSE